MKKLLIVLLSILFLTITSCKNQVNDSKANDTETVKVIIYNSSDVVLSFSIRNTEGEIYKSAELMRNEYIKINHFIKGEYRFYYQGRDLKYYIDYEINEPCNIEYYVYNTSEFSAMSKEYDIRKTKYYIPE